MCLLLCLETDQMKANWKFIFLAVSLGQLNKLGISLSWIVFSFSLQFLLPCYLQNLNRGSINFDKNVTTRLTPWERPTKRKACLPYPHGCRNLQKEQADSLWPKTLASKWIKGSSKSFLLKALQVLHSPESEKQYTRTLVHFHLKEPPGKLNKQ